MEAKNFIRRVANLAFADALGIVIRPDSVCVAHLSKRVDAITVVAVHTEKLEGPPEARAAEISSFLRRYGDDPVFEAARVSVVIDRASTFFAGFQLPSSAVANLASVVGFEIERLFPLPTDSLYYDYLHRSVGTVGERIAVTVTAAPRQVVEDAISAVTDSGLPIASITVEPQALADYAAWAGRGQGDLFAMFTSCQEREVLTLTSAGKLVSSHFVHGNSPRAVTAAREVETALPERAAEAAVLLVEDTAGKAEVLFGQLEGSPAAASVAEMVAIGTALGSLGEGLAEIDLLPKGMIRKAAGLGMTEMGLSAAVGVLALVLLLTTSLKESSISGALDGELVRLAPKVEAVLSREEKNRELLEQVEDLERQSRSKTTTYLREATRLIPKGTYLTAFRFREDRIEMDGVADRASSLIAALEASPYFVSVEFTSAVTKYLADQERFSLRMGLEK